MSFETMKCQDVLQFLGGRLPYHGGFHWPRARNHDLNLCKWVNLWVPLNGTIRWLEMKQTYIYIYIYKVFEDNFNKPHYIMFKCSERTCGASQLGIREQFGGSFGYLTAYSVHASLNFGCQRNHTSL